MADGYPCPSCGDTSAPLFCKDDAPTAEALEAQHAMLSCSYGCAACFTAAKLLPGMPFQAPEFNVTSTNHR